MPCRGWSGSKVCTVSLFAAALVCAAPASADENDDAFVAALPNGGITMSDPNTAIALARTVCAGLDANQPVSLVAMKLMQDTNLTPRQSGYFIGLSVAAYCPQDTGTLPPLK
jgi:hypothetical protein